MSTLDPVPATPYVVLARKYRPRSFEDLIGQEVMVRTLRNAFALDRIAQAYMLTGVRGVGKTTTARILARALNYQTPGGPDKPSLDMPMAGIHCQAILESRHVDVLEMDAASNTGIDDIREIIEAVRYKPASARYRVFIIDEVHMLSKAAFNGLLKTLEEPPPHVKFIFATTEIRKVPVTILSRCQRFDLRRVPVEVLADRFRFILGQEGQTADDDAVALLARAAEGSVRDGLSLLDQALSLGRGHVTSGIVRDMLGIAGAGAVLDVLRAVFSADAPDALAKLEALQDRGGDAVMILTDMADAVHAMTRLKAAGSLPADMMDAERAAAEALARDVPLPRLALTWQMLLKGLEEVSRAPRPFAALEMLVIRMCYTSGLPTPADLAKGNGAVYGGPQPAGLARPMERPGLVSQGGTFSPTPGQAIAPVAAGHTPAVDKTPMRPAKPRFASFTDVIAHASDLRDIKLKIALEEQVELVKFGANYIELHLLPAASPSLPQELAKKLTAWTGERWAVSLSDRRGETTIGDAKRAEEARLLEEVKRHPAVKSVMHHFPGATIESVAPLGKQRKPRKPE
jgi:DNA polymerase-3 subunit gamma/tau